MPIYDYVCASCGQVTEVIHGIDAPAPRFCPVCGREGTLRKSIAAPTVLFKGSGWAKKDRSSSSGRSKAGGTAGDSADAADGAGKGAGDAAASSASNGGADAGASPGAGSNTTSKGTGSTRAGEA